MTRNNDNDYDEDDESACGSECTLVTTCTLTTRLDDVRHYLQRAEFSFQLQQEKLDEARCVLSDARTLVAQERKARKARKEEKALLTKLAIQEFTSA
jgi:hypothetical protein